MRILFLAAALLLSGCVWSSGVPIYTPADAAHPLAPGRYRVTGGRPAPPIARVTVLENGLTSLTGENPGDEVNQVGFIALDNIGRRFLVWVVQEPGPESPTLQMHVLAEKTAEGEWTVYVPDCEGRNAALVVASGGRLEPDGGRNSCVFDNRQSLERAMRDAVVGPDRVLIRLSRIDG